MTALQLGLFNPALDAETRRLIDGLTCLRDVVPTALECVVHLADWHPVQEGGFSLSGDWTWTIRRKGLRFERRADWSGQSSKMRVVTWAELATHLGDDPRRPGLITWAESLTAPDRWKDLMRPHELWPQPGDWHPSYITGDHERPGWAERIAAWRTFGAICTDAIAELDPDGTTPHNQGATP